MKITLARAFKERSRLNRKISEVLNHICCENSMREDRKRNIDVKQKFEELHKLHKKLLDLKQAISHANVGISDKLIELAELKALYAHINGIPATEGEERVTISETRQIVAEIKKTQLLEEMEDLQKRIDTCQDDIDEFNARTRIEFEV